MSTVESKSNSIIIVVNNNPTVPVSFSLKDNSVIINNQENNLKTFEEKIESLENENKQLHENIKSLENENDDLLSKLENNEKEIENKNKEIERLKQENEFFKQKYENGKKKYKEDMELYKLVVNEITERKHHSESKLAEANKKIWKYNILLNMYKMSLNECSEFII